MTNLIYPFVILLAIGRAIMTIYGLTPAIWEIVLLYLLLAFMFVLFWKGEINER